MTPAYPILPLTSRPETVDALARLLIETVAHGGSIGFMHPVAPDYALMPYGGLTGTIVYWKRI